LLGLAGKALSNSGPLPTEYIVGCVLSEEVSMISLNDIRKWSLESRRSTLCTAWTEFGQCYLDEFLVSNDVPWIRLLVAVFSLWRPGFISRHFQVGFMVDKVELVRDFI